LKKISKLLSSISITTSWPAYTATSPNYRQIGAYYFCLIIPGNLSGLNKKKSMEAKASAIGATIVTFMSGFAEGNTLPK
jgi:hypothetical protein